MHFYYEFDEGTVALTELETQVMVGFKKDDYVGDYGFMDPMAMTWVKYFHENVPNIARSSLPGIIASLVKKGLMYTDGDALGLTDKGREVAAKL